MKMARSRTCLSRRQRKSCARGIDRLLAKYPAETVAVHLHAFPCDDGLEHRRAAAARIGRSSVLRPTTKRLCRLGITSDSRERPRQDASCRGFDHATLLGEHCRMIGASRLQQEMPKRFVHAGVEFPFRHPAAGAPHRFLYFSDGIGRTGREPGVTAVEHRKVVVMIAGREDRVARISVRRDNSCKAAPL